jgi:hypothetical protein
MFSFMGPQHGRIVHAHFDGTTVTVQCSPVYSFKNKLTAPLKTFLGYLMSSPVEPPSTELVQWLIW